MSQKTLTIFAIAIAASACNGPKGSGGVAGPAGPVGPIGTIQNAPVLTSVLPTVASPGMPITLTGQNFSATVANDRVFFGGVEGTVSAATGTTLTVAAPQGVPLDNDGVADVVVQVGDLESNAIPMQIGVSGQAVAGPTLPLTLPYILGGAVKLADGSVLISNVLSGIYAGQPFTLLEPDGTYKAPFSKEFGSKALEVTNLRSVGNTLQFQELILRETLTLDMATPEYSVVHGYSAANELPVDSAKVGTEMYATNGQSLFSIDPDGTVTSNLVTFQTQCGGGTQWYSLVGVGGLLYASEVSTGTVCVIDPASPATASPLVLTGDVPSQINRLDVAGGNLVASAMISNTGALATISVADGTTTTFAKVPASSGFGASSYADLGGGKYIVTAGLYNTWLVDSTGYHLRGSAYSLIGNAGAGVEVNGDWYVSMPPVGGAGATIAQIHPDGTYRVVASLIDPSSKWTHVEVDANGDLIASGFDAGGGRVDRISLSTGNVTPLIVAAPDPINSFVRDAAGNFYVADGTTNISRYDAQGGLLDAAFATLPAGGSTSIALSGTTLYIGAGTEIDKVTTAGGAATTFVDPSVGLNLITAMTFDKAGGLLVSDDNFGLSRITTDGFAQPWTTTGFDAGQLSVLPDGQVLVLDGTSMYTVLP